MADLASGSLIGRHNVIGSNIQYPSKKIIDQAMEAIQMPLLNLGILDSEPLEAEDNSLYVNSESEEMFIRMNGQWLQMAGNGLTGTNTGDQIIDYIYPLNCKNCGAGMKSKTCEYCKTYYGAKK